MDYRQIYDERAADYHRLVMAEDAGGAVARWLAEGLAGLEGEVLDVGAGTGRLAAMARRAMPGLGLVCCDGAAAMLEELRRTWPAECGAVPETVVADYRALPFTDGRFAGAMAGWALGHLTGFHPETWRVEAERALDELERVVVVGGAISIFETLGTGAIAPAPPRESLGELYALFDARGLERTVLRTDYRFAGRAEAERLVSFFFGDKKLAALEEREDGVWLIEWTGAWRRGAA